MTIVPEYLDIGGGRHEESGSGDAGLTGTRPDSTVRSGFERQRLGRSWPMGIDKTGLDILTLMNAVPRRSKPKPAGREGRTTGQVPMNSPAYSRVLASKCTRVSSSTV